MDSEKFRNHVLIGKEKLDSLYKSFTSIESNMRGLKKELIQQIVNGIDSLKFHQNFYYQLFKDKIPNNTFFMSFDRYHSSKKELNEQYEALGNDMKIFIKFYKSKFN